MNSAKRVKTRMHGGAEKYARAVREPQFRAEQAGWKPALRKSR
jgi:hypothetical protein